MRGPKRPHLQLVETAPDSPEKTGFPGQDPPSCDAAREGRQRPLSLVWITDDLLACTRDAWSRCIGRDVPEDEAIEMLLNVKRLAETLLNIAHAEGCADERRDMGAGIVP